MLKNKIIKCKGQALVEIALVLPILLLLLFGIIEFGRILNAYIMVSNASREGARYSAVGHTDVQVRQLVMDKTPNLNIVQSSIIINPGNTGAERERVIVTVPCDFQLITPIVKNIISPSGTFRIESSTEMRVE
jgi:Flp pilus assembly protein TadG